MILRKILSLFRRTNTGAVSRAVGVNCHACSARWTAQFSGGAGTIDVTCPECGKTHARLNKNGYFPWTQRCRGCGRDWTLSIKHWDSPVDVTCAHCGRRDGIMVSHQ